MLKCIALTPSGGDLVLLVPEQFLVLGGSDVLVAVTRCGAGRFSVLDVWAP